MLSCSSLTYSSPFPITKNTSITQKMLGKVKNDINRLKGTHHQTGQGMVRKKILHQLCWKLWCGAVTVISLITKLPSYFLFFGIPDMTRRHRFGSLLAKNEFLGFLFCGSKRALQLNISFLFLYFPPPRLMLLPSNTLPEEGVEEYLIDWVGWLVELTLN